MFREREKVIEREKEQEQESEREKKCEREREHERGGTLVPLGFVPKIPKVIIPCHLQGWDGIAKNPCK